MYVVNGAPGSGKTILALHFLEAGVQSGETVLCIALSQRVESLRQTAASVNIDTSGILFRELSSAQALETISGQQTVFDASEIELEDTMRELTQAIESVQPQRVVFDSISYLRMLANNALTYRKQLLILRDYVVSRDITVMLTDTQELVPGDSELIATAHGGLTLSKTTTDFGSDYRHLQVVKIRGSDYQPGVHDVEISDRGMQVYPLYNPSGVPKPDSSTNQLVKSGLAELDTLVGDGLLTGTSCLLIGPSGTGKTSIATLFANCFVQQGGKASIFLFDELTDTFLRRSVGLGMDCMNPYQNSDHVRIHEVGLGNITPGKFADQVEREVREWGARIVIVDSLTGYVKSMPHERRLITQLHELLIALSRQQVLTILVVAQHGVVGPNLDEGIDISYLADAVLLLRHFEANGSLRRAVSVYKKRYGFHENHIREILLKPGGIEMGPPLEEFSGILTGVPSYVGDRSNLMGSDG